MTEKILQLGADYKEHRALYFTRDYTPENVKKLQGEGWTLRYPTHVIAEQLEPFSKLGGEIPEPYKAAYNKYASLEKVNKGDAVNYAEHVEVLEQLETMTNEVNRLQKICEENQIDYKLGQPVINDSLSGELAEITDAEVAESHYNDYLVPDLDAEIEKRSIVVPEGVKYKADKVRLLILDDLVAEGSKDL